MYIDNKSVNNAREYDEVTRTMVQEGSLDVVYDKKWPIGFNEIAANLPATSESFDRVVLVEGAPGVVKSTLILHGSSVGGGRGERLLVSIS